MFKSSPRRRSFQPSVLNLDVRIMPTMDMPPGGWVQVPITSLVSLVPPEAAKQPADADLMSTISLTNGL